MITCKINKKYPKRFSRAKRKKLRAVDHIAVQVATRLANHIWEDPEFQKKLQDDFDNMMMGFYKEMGVPDILGDTTPKSSQT